MDVASIRGMSGNLDVVAALVGLAEQQTATEAGVAVLKQALDTQLELAAELFRSLGIGQNLDLRA